MSTPRCNFRARKRTGTGNQRDGVTLLELITVISIAAVLLALLFPAVQKARESARKMACQNNLKQIAIANESYLAVQGSYVLGRDGVKQWAVSWGFRLLPYLERQAAYDAHQYEARCDDTVNANSMRISVAEYVCPTRRQPASDRDFDNHSCRPVVFGVGTRGDYAGNAGQFWDPNDIYAWDLSPPPFETFGPIMTMRAISPRHVTGGTSETWLVGEKHIPVLPAGKRNRHDLSGDMAFLAGDHPWTIQRVSQNGLAEDDVDPDITRFGSAHQGLVYFVFLDGHVEARSVTTDPNILHREATIGTL